MGSLSRQVADLETSHTRVTETLRVLEKAQDVNAEEIKALRACLASHGLLVDYDNRRKQERADEAAKRSRATQPGMCRCGQPKQRSDWWGCNACVNRDKQEGLCRRD